METVRVFNQELSGLYESKPPISKAKMASITRSAMKAIKFYKHVVQSVEKFISKCKSEYKIPGLYVIDSIVRQSRHQFGPDKDVFAPRFARNMEGTFAHLFRCPPEDKSKIIRVLNLWQKNMVFAPEVIQPLFDLANPEHPLHQQYNAAIASAAASEQAGGSNGMNTSAISHDSPINLGHDDHGSSAAAEKSLDQNTIRQLQQFQQILMRQTSGGDNALAAKDQVKFNKKLLDFDYGSEDEDDKNSPSVPSTTLPDNNNIAAILSDPNVLKQLQNLQKLKQHEMEEKQSKLTEMRLQEEKFEKHLASVLKKLPFANECDLSRQPPMDMNPGPPSIKDAEVDDFGMVTEVISDTHSSSPRSPVAEPYKSAPPTRRRKSRSRSRDRRDRDRGSRRRSRSRSRSRSHSPRRGRSGRGSSRERERISQKDKEREKERERERKKRGLPEIKKEHLSVCSTTLWVGHLSKLVQQEELSDTFGKYGDIVSIDLIPPRGCAFIVMNRRQDAFKCMQSLKNHKMHGRTITISWATGKGVKSKDWKDYWDIDLGVSYIPWNKLKPGTDMESLEEGGMFDEDTIPPWVKEKATNVPKKPEVAEPPPAVNPIYTVDTSQPPPPPTTAMMGMGMPPFPMGAVPRMPMMGLPMVPGMGINVPPPNLMMPGALANPPPLPMHGFGVLPPPPPTQAHMHINAHPPQMHGGDEMDIEMEDETSNQSHAPIPPGGAAAFFNQPPPPLVPPNLTFMPFSRGQDLVTVPPNPNFNPKGDNSQDDHEQERGRSRGDFDRRGGGRERERDRDRDRDRDRGSRDRDRGNRGGDFDRDSRERRNHRDNDAAQRADRPSRWGSNERNFGGRGGPPQGGGGGGGSGSGNEGSRDERPLSERLRELAGADFSQRIAEGLEGPPFGRNFRGGRNMNNDGGDDFNNRGGGGDDFVRRGAFPQGGRFNQNPNNNNPQQRGGRGFNNRGGFMPQNRPGRDGPGGDLSPMNIMSLLNIGNLFGNNEQGGSDNEQQQFFERGGGGNFNNRRGNNWNEGGGGGDGGRGDRGRGGRGGRGNWREMEGGAGGGNWRDNNDGNRGNWDNNEGSGNDNNDNGRGGGRFGRRNEWGNQRRDNQAEQQPSQPDDNKPQPQKGGQGGGAAGAGLRWDENDETWDAEEAAVPIIASLPDIEAPKDKSEPRLEPESHSNDGNPEAAHSQSEDVSHTPPHEPHTDNDLQPQEQHTHAKKQGGCTPLFDESQPTEPEPASFREPEREEMPINDSPPRRTPEPVHSFEPVRIEQPVEVQRPQLYSPPPPPPGCSPSPVYDAPESIPDAVPEAQQELKPPGTETPPPQEESSVPPAAAEDDE